MTPPNDITRCTARKSADPAAERCPRRLECERYIAFVGLEIGEVKPVSMHLCTTDSYEARIPAADVDA
jgi:hypothetical protein